MDQGMNFNPGFVPPTGNKSNKSVNYQPHQYKHPCTWEGCDRMFVCPQNVEQHVREKHTGERPFACDYCFATFARQGSLNRHVRDVHKMKIDGARGKKRNEEDDASVAPDQQTAFNRAEQLEQESYSPIPKSTDGLPVYYAFAAQDDPEYQQGPPSGYASVTNWLDEVDATSTFRPNPYSTASAYGYVTDPSTSYASLDPTLSADAVFGPEDFPFTTTKHQTSPVAQPEVCIFCQTSFSTQAELATHYHGHGMDPFPTCVCVMCERTFGGRDVTVAPVEEQSSLTVDASGQYGAQASIQGGHGDDEEWLIPPADLQALQLFGPDVQPSKSSTTTDAVADDGKQLRMANAHDNGIPQEYHQP